MYVITFMQVLYWLAFYPRGNGSATSFLVGFRFAHLKFFPNFFMPVIPAGYRGTYSAAPFLDLTFDNLLLRNAGETFSLWILMVGVVIFYHLMNYLGF
jgi:hypothetical protein